MYIACLFFTLTHSYTVHNIPQKCDETFRPVFKVQPHFGTDLPVQTLKFRLESGKNQGWENLGTRSKLSLMLSIVCVFSACNYVSFWGPTYPLGVCVWVCAFMLWSDSVLCNFEELFKTLKVIQAVTFSSNTLLLFFLFQLQQILSCRFSGLLNFWFGGLISSKMFT